MKKAIIIFGLLAGMVCLPAQAVVKKQKKYQKQEVVIPVDESFKEKPQDVKITNPAKELYGEWTIIELRRKEVSTEERPYIYLDFQNGNKVYGNNGCNAINGTFSCKAYALSFGEMITTMRMCNSKTSDYEIMQALGDAKTYRVSELYNVQYMSLFNSRGNEVLKLRRLNLDYLNGPWRVKQIGNNNVLNHNIKMVIDTDMRTINALTKCNVINGIISIDPRKELEVQFEDLRSSHNKCEDIDIETQMLIHLEETVSCKRINDKEMALLDRDGNIVIRLLKTTLTHNKKKK